MKNNWKTKKPTGFNAEQEIIGVNMILPSDWISEISQLCWFEHLEYNAPVINNVLEP